MSLLGNLLTPGWSQCESRRRDVMDVRGCIHQMWHVGNISMYCSSNCIWDTLCCVLWSRHALCSYLCTQHMDPERLYLDSAVSAKFIVSADWKNPFTPSQFFLGSCLRFSAFPSVEIEDLRLITDPLTSYYCGQSIRTPGLGFSSLLFLLEVKQRSCFCASEHME